MWIERIMENIDRRTTEITFSPHLFCRSEYWSLELDKIEDTVRNGLIYYPKSEQPNKISFCRYFGKENISYIVITRVHKHFIEVKTAWPKKGR